MVVTTDTGTPWMTTARELEGTREFPGGADNPVILGWIAFIGNLFAEFLAYCRNYKHDEIAWCGLFVAYCMAKNGIKPVVEFLWARNWAKFGTPLSVPRPGCVMVFIREGGGHVAFLVRIEGDHFVVLGGNQGNAVNETRIHKGRLLAAVWPDQVAAQSSVRTPDDVRVRMGKAIINFEARRDAQNRLQVFTLHPEDGGGTYEVAGINDRYHPVEAAKLKEMIQSGRHVEAEQFVGAFVASYTDVADVWTNSWGLEFALRDQVFNRGPAGSAKILQRALISLGDNIGEDGEDGEVGPLTQAAMRRQEANVPRLLAALRASRESYERNPVGRDENSRFWKGLVNRWNNVTVIAQRFAAEQPKGETPVTDPFNPTPLPPPTGANMMVDMNLVRDAITALDRLGPFAPFVLAMYGSRTTGGRPLSLPPPMIEHQPLPERQPDGPTPFMPVAPVAAPVPVAPAPAKSDTFATSAGFLGLLTAAAGQLFGFMPTVGEAATGIGPAVTATSLLATAGGAIGAFSPILGIIAKIAIPLISRLAAKK